MDTDDRVTKINGYSSLLLGGNTLQFAKAYND